MSREKSTSIKVIARFRPMISLEKDHGDLNADLYKFPNESTVTVSKGADTPDVFVFDRTFSPECSQPEIFEFIGRPIVEDVLSGYNGTVFAYGQTGSGKTFTMMGNDIFDDSARGIIPRAIGLIFSSLTSQSNEIEYTIKCSMLEIYKEKLQDLLMHGPKLRIKADPRKGIYVDGLSEIYVVCEEEVLNALAVGEKNRTIASTKMNTQSSRSHQIFMIEVSQKMLDDTSKRGTLNLVDLAGSEKINQTGATGEKLEEAKKINLSLSALGNVIHALTSKADHIPYRDSKLTRLLQESLGGNFKTSLIVNCSPHPRNTEDTLNTLRFAQRAKTIKNAVKVNVTKSIEAYIKTIEKLRAKLEKANQEIVSLKKTIKDYGGFLRSNTMISEPLSAGLERDKESEVTDLLTKVEELQAQITFFSNDNSEIKSQLLEAEQQIVHEKIKTADAQAKAAEFFGKLQINLAVDKEKENNFFKITAENKKLAAQVDYLQKLLKDFSYKYSERLLALKNGENIDLQEFADSKIEEIQKNLKEIAPGPIEKYFPESIKIKKFFTSNPEISSVKDFDLKKKILESEIVNCELNKKYWDIVWKYSILRENYITMYNNYDMQKKMLNGLKKNIEEMNNSYLKTVRKLNKIINSAGGFKNNFARVRRPVKNNVPVIFNEKEQDPKEYFRKASLFHLLSNRLDAKITENSLINENLMQKTSENNLHIQKLMNKQLQSRISSIKEENIRLKSLLETFECSQSQFSGLENEKIDKIIDLVKVLFSESPKIPGSLSTFSENFHFLQGKPSINTLKSFESSQMIEGDEEFKRHDAKESYFYSMQNEELRGQSYIHNEQGSNTPKVVERSKKKSMTSPPDLLLTIKSSLSKKFIKEIPPILEKKIGD